MPIIVPPLSVRPKFCRGKNYKFFDSVQVFATEERSKRLSSTRRLPERLEVVLKVELGSACAKLATFGHGEYLVPTDLEEPLIASKSGMGLRHTAKKPDWLELSY